MNANNFYRTPVIAAQQQSQANSETVVWQGTSSQWINFLHNIVCALIIIGLYVAAIKFSVYIFIGIPIILIKFLYNWYYTRTAKYILTNQRLIRKSGVINVVTFEIELYRIKDALLYEPIHLRLFSLGNIYLASSQRATHNFTIEAVQQAAQLREVIRNLVEKRRTEKGVGEFDASSFNN
jgi:hypothetical protein